MINNEGERNNISKQRLYGIIGEIFSEQHLCSTMDSYTRADIIDGIGYSWLSPYGKNEFDFQDLRRLSRICRSRGICDIPNNERPCLTNEFHEPNYESHPISNTPYTGDNKYRYYCSGMNTDALLELYGEIPLEGADKFISDYMACHHFITNLYQNKSFIRDEENLSIGGNIWKGHPGRIDYFGIKDEEFYCIDSKVNSSRLSLWQKVRLSWMHEMGHKCQVYNIKFTTYCFDELKEVYFEFGPISAIKYLSPSLEVIDIDPKEYTEAQKLLNDRERFMTLAKANLGVNLGNNTFI